MAFVAGRAGFYIYFAQIEDLHPSAGGLCAFNDFLSKQGVVAVLAGLDIRAMIDAGMVFSFCLVYLKSLLLLSFSGKQSGSTQPATNCDAVSLFIGCTNDTELTACNKNRETSRFYPEAFLLRLS